MQMQNEESHGSAEDGLGAVRPDAAIGAAGSQAYLGQVEAFAFNFAPPGWLPCDGRTLQIAQNQALFALLAFTYGGDGRMTFGIPRMAPIGINGPHYFISTGGTFPPRS
jgi:microcystin-dependent protein